ncbi:hypothetical protein GJAV_G00040000 [Gymnothorax javanicus]|nr:hypothetical protein GJAV_G00040000 [Gymnothorax javanicus]
MGSGLSARSGMYHDSNISNRTLQRMDSCGEAGRNVNCARGYFPFTSLILNSDKLPEALRKSRPNPYVRRVAWVREIQKLLSESKVTEACDVLRLLRKDLGLEGTSLNDVLHRNTPFLNLVDPISHELLLSLARDLQCPKLDSDHLKSSSKTCRQLIYHLSPHSKWLPQGKEGRDGAGKGVWLGMLRRKPHACVKAALQQNLHGDTVDLSSLPLSDQDLRRMARYLHGNGDGVVALHLSFTGLRDEQLGGLLSTLATLPNLATLALNGNRLTAAAARHLSEALKDSAHFPALVWVDLGNNVDIFTLPQPLLVALRRRTGQRSGLPTIYELRAEEEQGEEELWRGSQDGGGIEVWAAPLGVTAQLLER